MFFLSFNNTNINFTGPEKLIWRFYTIIEVLSTTSRIKFIDKIEFVKTVLDKNSETLVIYIIVLEAELLIYLLMIAQIVVL